MTDLRKAAQALVERWDSPQWGGSAENLKHTGEYIATLRAALAQPDVPEGWVPPAGMKVADVGFVWDGELMTHTPKVVVHFEPVPANSPCDAKGWGDRDAFVAMLAAAPKGGA